MPPPRRFIASGDHIEVERVELDPATHAPSPVCGDYPRRRGLAREIKIFATGHFASFSTQSANSGHSARAWRQCPVARPAAQATIPEARLSFVMWILTPGKEFRYVYRVLSGRVQSVAFANRVNAFGT
jgi:hypothetical protein